MSRVELHGSAYSWSVCDKGNDWPDKLHHPEKIGTGGGGGGEREEGDNGCNLHVF